MSGDGDDVRCVSAAGSFGVERVDRAARDGADGGVDVAGLVEGVGVQGDLEAELVGGAQGRYWLVWLTSVPGGRGEIIEKYGDPAEGGGGPDAYRDPRQIGSWVEKKFDEYGMDLPDGAREMIDAAREGEFPEPVKDL